MRNPFAKAFDRSGKEQDSPLVMFAIRRTLSVWPYLIAIAIPTGVMMAISNWIPVSPPGAAQTVKISPLDWFNAKRYATKADQIERGVIKGDLYHTWKMAILENPGSDLYKSCYLETLLRHDRRRENWEDAQEISSDLLEITQTNVSELSLACRVYEHYQLNDQLLGILSDYSGEKTPEIEKSHLFALFNQDRISDFQNRLLESSEATQKDSIFELYEAAIFGSCSSNQLSQSPFEILEAAATVESTTETALRLLLYVSHRQGDLERFEKSFTRLAHRFEDRTQDHLLYWNLLQRNGQLEKARAEAKAFVNKPKSGREVMSIADAYTELGLKKLGLQFLDHYAETFGVEEEGRYAQSQILIKHGDWRELQRLAVAIRSDEDQAADLYAYSFYLEGRAFMELGRHDYAARAFESISNFYRPGSDYALSMGSRLAELDFPEPAHQILSSERMRYRNSTTYWEVMLDVNRALGNTTQMLVSAESLKRLAPQTDSYSTLYSMLLLTQTHRLDEALTHSKQTLGKIPENPVAQVNYGHALVVNERSKEAQRILSSIDASALNDSDLNRLYLAWMEFHFQEQRLGEAWKAAKNVDPESLLPEFRSRFQNIWETLQLEVDENALGGDDLI